MVRGKTCRALRAVTQVLTGALWLPQGEQLGPGPV